MEQSEVYINSEKLYLVDEYIDNTSCKDGDNEIEPFCRDSKKDNVKYHKVYI